MVHLTRRTEAPTSRLGAGRGAAGRRRGPSSIRPSRTGRAGDGSLGSRTGRTGGWRADSPIARRVDSALRSALRRTRPRRRRLPTGRASSPNDRPSGCPFPIRPRAVGLGLGSLALDCPDPRSARGRAPRSSRAPARCPQSRPPRWERPRQRPLVEGLVLSAHHAREVVPDLLRERVGLHPADGALEFRYELPPFVLGRLARRLDLLLLAREIAVAVEELHVLPAARLSVVGVARPPHAAHVGSADRVPFAGECHASPHRLNDTGTFNLRASVPLTRAVGLAFVILNWTVPGLN